MFFDNQEANVEENGGKFKRVVRFKLRRVERLKLKRNSKNQNIYRVRNKTKAPRRILCKIYKAQFIQLVAANSHVFFYDSRYRFVMINETIY